MQISSIAVLVLACGGIGGLVDAVLAGDLHLPHREDDFYSPGWIGDMVIGGVAALLFWALYRPTANFATIGTTRAEVPVAFTIAQLVCFVVIGIGAAHTACNRRRVVCAPAATE